MFEQFIQAYNIMRGNILNCQDAKSLGNLPVGIMSPSAIFFITSVSTIISVIAHPVIINTCPRFDTAEIERVTISRRTW